MKVTHLPYASTFVDLLLMLCYLWTATYEAECYITPYQNTKEKQGAPALSELHHCYFCHFV
jgi:hypothetical protein